MQIAGIAVGLSTLTNFLFDPSAPHTCCALCGAVFQQDIDRYPQGYATDAFDNNIHLVRSYAESLRKNWSHQHAKQHPIHEHEALKKSGRKLTPEAAIKLAAFGVISVIDAVMDDEIEHAYLESKPIPTDDAQAA